jgi:hypothetical protein
MEPEGSLLHSQQPNTCRAQNKQCQNSCVDNFPLVTLKASNTLGRTGLSEKNQHIPLYNNLK